MNEVHGGLKDIFNTILKGNEQADSSKLLPPIIVLHGNGNIIAPGGTVHMIAPRSTDTQQDKAA